MASAISSYLCDRMKSCTDCLEPARYRSSTVLQTVVFENAELEQILSELSDHYHVSVEYRNEEVRHLRLYTKWEPTAPLTEMLERINRFEKVNITLKEQQMVVE